MILLTIFFFFFFLYLILSFFFFFFFNDTATTEIYTLSLHDALPISIAERIRALGHFAPGSYADFGKLTSLADVPHDPPKALEIDRKSTRLNSSHLVISYAVFCLKKKKKTQSSLSY